VPNKIITIRNKDALWMTAEIKGMILEKAKIYNTGALLNAVEKLKITSLFVKLLYVANCD